MSPRALVAARLPAGQALAAALRRAWDGGDALLPVSPALPQAEVDRLLARLRPAHLLDDGGRRALPDPLPVEDDVALVVATSGSTGPPRGVALTRAALEFSAVASLDRVGGREGRWLCCLPPSSVGGLQVLLRAWVAGGEALLHPHFDLGAVAADLPQVAHVSLVPTMLGRLLDAGVDLSGLRTVLLGGAPASAALLARARAARAPVVTTYGMTETAGGCVYDGVPLTGVGVAVGIGSDRRVRLRGPMLAAGYREAAGTTSLPLEAGGWFVTGDLGRVVDGRLQVTGRADDMIISGGTNVSAVRVADLVAAHPAVAEAAVVGVPDPDWGQRVVAVIVAAGGGAPDLEGLRAFLRDHAAPAELPRELVVTQRLPLLPGGKVDRMTLRRWLAERMAGA
jgi:o-succinylbenzoate---CoA ligase